MLQRRNTSWAKLAAHLGNGRSFDDGKVQLSFQKTGGIGWVWPFSAGDCSGQFFCDEQSWCHWLHPLLYVPNCGAVDPSLLPTLTALTFSTLQPIFGHALQLDTPRVDELPYEWDPVFDAISEGNRLSLRYLANSYEGLMALTAAWPEVRVSAEQDSIRLPIPLALGWLQLTHSEIAVLRTGDALVLNRGNALTESSAVLFLNRPLASVVVHPNNECRVEEIMTELDSLYFENASAEQLPMTIVAEIGRMTLPLGMLTTLKVGQVIQEALSLDHEVRLTLQGVTIATGSVLDIGGRWVVRIERLAEGWGNHTADDSSAGFLGKAVGAERKPKAPAGIGDGSAEGKGAEPVWPWAQEPGSRESLKPAQVTNPPQAFDGGEEVGLPDGGQRPPTTARHEMMQPDNPRLVCEASSLQRMLSMASVQLTQAVRALEEVSDRQGEESVPRTKLTA